MTRLRFVALAICAGCNATAIVRTPERAAKLIVSVDSLPSSDTISFLPAIHSLPHPPVAWSQVQDGGMYVGATSGAPDTEILLVILQHSAGFPLQALPLQVFVRPTIAEAQSTNALAPTPSSTVQPTKPISLAFLYLDGVGAPPTDSTVVTFVSGHVLASYTVPAKPLMRAALAVTTDALTLPHTGIHNYQFRLEGHAPPDSSTLTLLLIKRGSDWWPITLRWNNTHTWHKIASEKLTEFRLYIIDLPESLQEAH